jgi:tetratricopeptide (TPR) repeat protein
MRSTERSVLTGIILVQVLSGIVAASIAALACVNQSLAQDLASTCFGLGPPTEIVAACELLIADDPRHAQAYQARGNAWYKMGEYDDAVSDYTASLAIDAKYIRIYYNRGLAWEAEGKLQNALQDYRTFASLDPSFSDGQKAIARVSRQLKQGAAVTSVTPARKAEEVIGMEQIGGVFVVPIRFNDVITLTAIVDSGASDVSVPADIVLTLVRTNTLTTEDFLGEQTYVLADGSKVPSRQFRIRSLRVGNKTIKDVIGSVASVNASILLGQSFLRKFKSWSVDNENHTLALR